MTHYYKKDKLPEYYKIGSKYDNQAYANKNINPEMNFLNKQINEEERMARMKKERQLEDLNAFAYNHQIARQSTHTSKVNYDNLTGKIGQDRRNIKLGMNSQQQEQYSRDAIMKNQRNYMSNGSNIINGSNSICGFFDPFQPFPKTSYQVNYQAKVNPDLYPQKMFNYQQQQQQAKSSSDNPLLRQQQQQQRQMQMQKEKEKYANQQQEKEYQEMMQKMKDSKLSDEGQGQAREQEMRMERNKQEQMQYDIEKQRYEQQMRQRELNEQQQQQRREMIPENMTEEEYQKAYEEYVRQERMREMSSQQQQGANPNQQYSQTQYQEKEYPINQEHGQSSDRNRPISEEEYKAYMEFIRKTEDSSKATNKERIQSPDTNPNQSPQQKQMTEEEYYKYLKNPEQNSISPEYIQKLQQREREMMMNQNNPNFEQDSISPEYIQKLQQREREMMMNQNNPEDKNLNQIDEEYIKKLKAYEELVQGDQQNQEKEYQQQQQQMISNTDRPNQSQHQLQPKPQPLQQQQYDPPLVQYQRIPNYQAMCNQLKDTGDLPSIKARKTKENYIPGNPYTGKNIELGQSSLSTNPIVHPVNTYKFDYNRLQNPLISNTGRLMNVGNTIIDNKHNQ